MRARPELPLPVQAGYATADVGLNCVETLLRLYVLVFYTDAVGLRADLAGYAAAIAIVWDAATDPVMGAISDRTRHRFGGRRGWLPAGGALLALGMIAVFWPPALDSQAEKFGWLLLAYCFLNTGMTVLSVPYMAMAGEMTAQPSLRLSLFGWRFAFANVGALLAAVLPRAFLGENRTTVGALPAVSAVAAALAAATALVSWAATARVRFAAPPLPRQSLGAVFAAPFQCPSFGPLLLAYVVANTGIGVNAAAFFYYYEHVLELPEVKTLNVLAVFMLVFTGSLAGWVRLGRKWGKRRPLVVGAAVLGIGTTALYVLLPAGAYGLVLALGAVGLGSFVGCIVLIDAMLTDVVDHDWLRTRQWRSGQFFGVWRFAGKLARALSVVVVGVVMDLAGYVPLASEQPSSVDATLVVLFGPGVGGFFVLAAWILGRYRFDDAAQARVRTLLARRRARVSSPAVPLSPSS